MAITPKPIPVVVPFDTIRAQRMLDRITLSFDWQGIECLSVSESLANDDVWVLPNIKGEVSGKLVP